MFLCRYPQQLKQLLLTHRAYPSACFFITSISRFLIPQFWMPTVSGCSIIRIHHLLVSFRVCGSCLIAEITKKLNFRTSILYGALNTLLDICICGQFMSLFPYSDQSWQSIGFFFVFNSEFFLSLL